MAADHGDIEMEAVDGDLSESLLSEASDANVWTDPDPNTEGELVDKYFKMQRQVQSECEARAARRRPAVVPVKRKLYKIRVNDFLFSDRFKQLKSCVLENRVQKMEDIDKMLRGETVDEQKAVEEAERFLKQRQDDQLLRDLVRAEQFVKDSTSGKADTDTSQLEQRRRQETERLLDEW